MQANRAPRIKNRAPAPIQITAEQLLREAQERQEAPFQAAKARVEDYEELEEYRGRKRSEFESRIRTTRTNATAWIKYAQWEASQGEMLRARSVFERALDVDPYSIPIWTRYIETELKNRNVNHARNLLDRAVSILPRMNQMWYKYVHLEELLGNVQGVRQIFERWMVWEPDEKAWSAFVAFELRYGEKELASKVWERAVTCHPDPREWIKWAKFEEEERQDLDKAREVFTMALDFFGEDEDKLEKAQTVYTAFAKMEARAKEYERARAIYKYALERLPRSKSQGIYSSYTRFEKQFGDRQGVEDTVLGKRRIQYEEELSAEGGGSNYDTWFDYVKLEEEAFRWLLQSGLSLKASEVLKARNRVRELYERAVGNVPPSCEEKRHWRRYIFLWLNYALFEEVDAKDTERAREVYKAAIALVPHKAFTFAKLWLQYAHFEIRQLDLGAARKILGAAIGMCPKERLFRGYVDLELSLKEFDRARKIYEKALEWDPSNSRTWVRFAELEKNLFDDDRARGIFRLAIEQQGGMDMPEVVWKAYIDYEFEMREWNNVNRLYESLVERSGHVKVWISYALAQIGSAIAEEEDEDAPDEDEDEAEQAQERRPPKEHSEEALEARRQRREERKEQTRRIFDRAYKDLKMRGLKEERVVLLEAWKSFEAQHGADADGLNAKLKEVEARMPRVVKKRREAMGGEGMEEYYDMLFPDDEDGKGKPSFKLLQMAHAWRAQQQAQAQEQAQAQAEEPEQAQEREEVEGEA
ncbi:pre-mRNA-splicing factor CLF1 [Tilletiaria anomala UBC 951]|uniref:Pre-mRNA-splicing factor CLF1 n=1 Tax=Tilletiaria anomala (strain ATCC 24038 / CBS 436.72 / UBC 951) TaxID=1037660 RepID=A0A066VPN7_TILAU|nr:pre-mRNA-splicing factor CLF1 [Tilletiaria anomala UBC 951]KDN43411.1 pre-mRNA-splicing factor CLF1 [Tilletiaria anomala UBC 951]